MIENFILEKLLELIPSKNDHDLTLQKEINKIQFIPKNINFQEECFRILNKIKKEYNNNSNIKKTFSLFKKQIIAHKEPKILLSFLYLITKFIREENYMFEKTLDKEMAEIDLSISMTSLEIQIEELLKSKLDFENVKLEDLSTIDTNTKPENEKNQLEKSNSMKILHSPSDKLFLMINRENINVKSSLDGYNGSSKYLISKMELIEQNAKKNSTDIKSLQVEKSQLQNKIEIIEKNMEEMKLETTLLKKKVNNLEKINNQG